MFKNRVIKLFLIISMILLTVGIAGCADHQKEEILKAKNESIGRLNMNLEQIQSTNPEYSIILIEDVIETAKTSINNVDNLEDITTIEEEALEKIGNLTLTDDEIDAIKDVYLVEKKDWLNGVGKRREDSDIIHFLGRYDDKNVVIIDGDYAWEMRVAVIGPTMDYYWIFCETMMQFFTFHYLPEQVSVFCDGNYYTLEEACESSVISDEELVEIYNNFKKIDK